MNDVRMIERKPNGQHDLALGTDSVVPGVGLHTLLHRIHALAIEHARSLRFLKRYTGYSIRGMAPVYFSDIELAWIYNEVPA